MVGDIIRFAELLVKPMKEMQRLPKWRIALILIIAGKRYREELEILIDECIDHGNS